MSVENSTIELLIKLPFLQIVWQYNTNIYCLKTSSPVHMKSNDLKEKKENKWGKKAWIIARGLRGKQYES